jgi:hypothetical protein
VRGERAVWVVAGLALWVALGAAAGLLLRAGVGGVERLQRGGQYPPLWRRRQPKRTGRPGPRAWPRLSASVP